jgi:hypothetical protein
MIPQERGLKGGLRETHAISKDNVFYQIILSLNYLIPNK